MAWITDSYVCSGSSPTSSVAAQGIRDLGHDVRVEFDAGGPNVPPLGTK